MKKYFALAIVVVVLSGGAFFSQQWFIGSFIAENSSQTSNPDPITFTATTTGTVLDAMRARSAEGSLNFSGRDFPGLGFFVEEINGRKNADGHYWILYVNGTSSQTGASQTFLSAGDVIEWKYEKGY